MLHKFLCFRHFEDTSLSTKRYPTIIEELCHQFSLADLRKSTNNFDKNRIIGHGDCATVYKGCLQLNGATDYTIALKRMKKMGYVIGFRNESELLCQIRHPNLVSLIGFCNHKDEKILVYEYMSNGSFHDHLYCRKMEPLSWKKRLEICIGVAYGLHYLHTGAKRIIFHLDIKPNNILLDNNMVPKLGKFGHSFQGSYFMSEPKSIHLNSVTGASYYMAPEYGFHLICSDKCDVYSFGVVLLEVVCATDKQTFLSKLKKLSQGLELIEYKELQDELQGFIDDDSIRRELSLIKRFPVEEIIHPTLMGKIAPECWEAFINITKKCVNFDPNERPTIGEVELELERALSLQEEADVRKTNGDYTLLSTTIIDVSQMFYAAKERPF